MNKAIIIGRLTRDPEVRYSAGADPITIARYTLAVDRKFKSNDGQAADFIQCVAFGKSGEFVEKYLHKGTKIAVTGRIQTGSYTNKDGQKVYTFDIVAEEHEFVESRRSQEEYEAEEQHKAYMAAGYTDAGDGFMNIPDGVDEELPFN